MNNLGRLWLEQRQYSRAQGLLLQAVSDLEAQQNLTNVTMMLAYSNLALADMGLGRLAAAVPLLDKALLAAAANDHPLQGPLRVYKADALCRQRQFRPGLQLLDQARTFIEQRYAQEPWRKAQLETVAALCLLGVKRVGEASRALDSGLPVLLARWPADSAFGSDGVARAIRVYGEANETDKLAKYQALSRRVMP
jgi:tetratricopeptide (TPR) repeat protein